MSTRAFAFIALVVSLASLPTNPVGANPIDDLVHMTIHVEVPATDLIPGVAALRASCAVNASGEPLGLLAGETVRTTIGAAAGPCTIVLRLLGIDVPLPVFNTTPLGKSSFYLPGISTVTIGVADVSVDLETSLTSTTEVDDGIANPTPSEIGWNGWGVQRLVVHGMDGVGSVAVSRMNTTFTYAMSLGLTVYALSVEVYHLDLVRIGSFVGSPALTTNLSVNLRPHPLAMHDALDVTSDRATLSWSGTIDSDVDHLELWLTGGTANVSYRLDPAATQAEVTVRPSTHYEARIVSVDRAGQRAPSQAAEFDTAAAPAAGIETQGGPVVTWTLAALAVLAGVVGYASGSLRGRRRD